MSNMGRPKAELVLSEAERTALEQLRRRGSIGAAMKLRASIVVLCAEGNDSVDVAEDLRITEQTVGKWRRRFLARRLDGLFDEPRVGRPRTVTDEDVQRVIDTTLHEKPRASTQWSTRKLAKELKLSRDAIQRVWRAFGLKPHRTVARRRSPCREIRSSSRRCATSSGSTCRRRTTQSCCASTRSRRCRRWIDRSPCCR